MRIGITVEFHFSTRCKSSLYTYVATAAKEREEVVASLDVVEVLRVLRRGVVRAEARLPARRKGSNLVPGSKVMIQ